MAQLWGQLSRWAQSGDMARYHQSANMMTACKRVHLVEGPLTQEMMQFMKCIAEDEQVQCRVELHYKSQPTTQADSKQVADGAKRWPKWRSSPGSGHATFY